MADVIRYAMEFNFPNALTNVCVMTGNILWSPGVPPNPTEMQAFADLFSEWWDLGVGGEGALKAQASSSCTLTRSTAQRFFPGPPDLPYESLSGVLGSIGGVPTPPQCAVVISERTGTATRRARGRMYMPGIASSDLASSGNLNGTRQQGIADSASGLLTAIPAINAGAAWGVWSRVAQVGYPILEVKVGNRIDTQRRRTLKPETYVVGT